MKIELIKTDHMSAFGIFALILTTAYIIYFAVVIIRDVTSSRKSAEDNSETETFDATFAEEQSVEVIETESGFAVGDNEVNAVPVAAVEESKPDTASTETDMKSIQDKLDADAEDIAQSVVHEKSFTDEEFEYVVTQGDKGQIDNANVLITRIPAEESKKTPAEDAPVIDKY